MKSFYTITLSLMLLLVLSSCKIIESRGQYVDDDALSTLNDKKMTKAGVIDLIGTPTVIPEYSTNTWYYIQRSLAKRAWFTPKVIEQRIVKIVFNNKELVSEVVVLNDSQNDEIKLISEYTKTYGTELNDIQKFVKNIGRFNKSADKKGLKKK